MDRTPQAGIDPRATSTLPRIDFYFDFISHNAYLAWTQIGALAARHGRVLRPVPVLFAGLLKHYGQLGPAEIPAKNAWMLRNVLRKAALAGIEINPPASHPFNPLVSLRVVSQPLAAQSLLGIVEALFRAAWCERRDLSDPSTVADAASAAGFDGAALVGASGEPAVKQRLRDTTTAAIAAGVFGVPSMIADGELFFGYDELPLLERFLRGEDPLPADALTAWERVRPSVQRER